MFVVYDYSIACVSILNLNLLEFNIISESWIHFSNDPLNIRMCTEIEKAVPIPMFSAGMWLLVKVVGVDIMLPGKTLPAEKCEDKWIVPNIINLTAKQVVIPPNVAHRLNVSRVNQP